MSKSFARILVDNNVIISPELNTHQIYDLLLVLGLVNNTPTRDKPYGILEWDIPYTPSPWVEQITGNDWNTQLNPILLKNGTWIHHSDEVNAKQINKALATIRRSTKNGKRIWKYILPWVIELDEVALQSTKPFKEFINSKYNTAMVGWDEHMRFVYKEKNNHLVFYDPWMKNLEKDKFFKLIKANVETHYGYRSSFANRKDDQSDENSCVIDSLARCMMIAEYSEEAAFWSWNENTFDYALVAARIIHIEVR